MKKTICTILMFTIIISVFCSCKKETLSTPNYPLDATAVAAALEEANLSWTIAEEHSWAENHTAYTLHDIEGRMIAVVSSAGEEQQRLLIITFMPSQNDQYGVMISLPEEEWESAAAFGTILYGGFENKHQVYDDFTENYDEKTTVMEQREAEPGVTNIYEERIEWKSEINDLHCIVRMGKRDVSLSQKDLSMIKFYNDDKYADTRIDK